MGIYLKAAVIICFILAGATFYFYRPGETRAQNPAKPYLSANQQQSQFPTNLNLECSGCHNAGKPIPYLGGEQFHKDAHGAFDVSIHAKVGAAGKPAADCADCHSVGGNMTTVLPAENPKSTVNRANISQTCGACHQGSATTFHLSIHGSRRDEGDERVASCADCHGSHGILPAREIDSTLNRAAAGVVCSKCHTENVAEYHASSHGMALNDGKENAPTCTTCHTAVSHLKAPLTLRDFNLQMINNCSKCHAQQAPSYRDTFHGQATALGFRPAATCADCHTPHHNLPASNPLSSVHKDNLVQTCSKCHANANPSFATYSPHPEPDNPDKSALVYYTSHFMEWLLMGVFSFFGLHTVLWLQRSVVAYLKEKHEKSPDDKLYVVRFARAHRFTHLLIVISFLGLAATGLPLMYYYTEWGQTLVSLHGGLEVTRFLHRICAGITLVYASYHVYFIVRKAVYERKYSVLYGPDSMMIRKQDFIDVFNMFRWFLYLGPRPRLDRWTYWEKFDYFAVFWGIPVIGLSGLMLWFPNFFTSFLPGVVLNVAMIVHGEEALMATAFIFAFHFFHNHLRPENFPMDVVMFTGKMTLTRFKDERPVEYERLLSEGKLDSIMTDAPSAFAQIASRIFGFAAYITGLIIVVAIFVTLLTTKH
jgi:cytochrome b subunit of formate dehydrogenase/nitrate/TMAO reductase-like tetraheme cytochrome c subunit